VGFCFLQQCLPTPLTLEEFSRCTNRFKPFSQAARYASKNVHMSGLFHV